MTQGAHFFKADLHTHSPASLDHGDKGITAKDFVNAALKAGLDIVAITDHNSAAWCDAIHSAAKGTSLTVLPGVEVSTPHGHILVLFDVATAQAKIDDFLSQVGIGLDQRGKKEAMSADVETVLEKATACGGLAIAAHANSSNGLLQVGAPGQFRIRVYHQEELAALEFTKQVDVEKFAQGKVNPYKPKVCVQGSDAHQLSELGRRFTFFKMDGVSLDG